jgi:DNA-binding response OmpR family regulator
MKTILDILIVGREKAISDVVERLINTHEGWKAAVATTEAEAAAVFKTRRFPVVLVCAGFSAEEEAAVRATLMALDPAVVVIRHYGGGSGLLENEILGILSQHGTPGGPGA